MIPNDTTDRCELFFSGRIFNVKECDDPKEAFEQQKLDSSNIAKYIIIFNF